MYTLNKKIICSLVMILFIYCAGSQPTVAKSVMIIWKQYDQAKVCVLFWPKEIPFEVQTSVMVQRMMLPYVRLNSNVKQKCVLDCEVFEYTYTATSTCIIIWTSVAVKIGARYYCLWCPM